MGIKRDNKTKKGKINSALTAEHIGERNHKRATDHDPYRAGEQSGKRAKPDARSVMRKPHKYVQNRAKSPKSDQNRTWGHGQHPHPPRSEISEPDRRFSPLFPRPIAPSFFIDTLQYLFLSVPYYSTFDGLLSIYVM